MNESYTRAELRSLVHAEDEGLFCPRCGTPLDRRPIPPRRDVSYVRDRVWVVCPGCQRTGVLDRREDR